MFLYIILQTKQVKKTMKFTNSFLSITLLCISSILSATHYKIRDIGNSDVQAIFASDINQQGQVSGICKNHSTYYRFLWDELNDLSFQNHSSPGYSVGPGCPPYVNNNGIMSMNVISDSGDTYFIKLNKLCKNTEDNVIESSLKWQDNVYNSIRVNNNNEIVGSLSESNSLVIYNEKNKTITYIKSPLKYPLQAAGINDLGWVIGSYYDGTNYNGVLWTPEFGTQILPEIRPLAINNLGVIVGINHQNRAALWNKGKLVDLSEELKVDSDPSTKVLWISVISGINDRNQMSGWGPTSVHNLHNVQAIFITPIEQ